MINVTEDHADYHGQKDGSISKNTRQIIHPFLSVIIPAFNEEARLPETLKLMGSLTKDISLEIIVVCDGCTDNTRQIASQWTDRLPLRIIAYPENRGKGYAVQQGILCSHGQVIAFMDADGSTHPSELVRLAPSVVSRNADIIIGSRRIDGGEPNQPLHRRLLGKLLSIAVQIILSLPFRDTQCGFKLFRRECALELFKEMQCTGFEFDLEILYRAHNRKIRIIETGVAWKDRKGSKVSPIHDGFRMLRTMLAIKRQKQIDSSFNKIRGGIPNQTYQHAKV